MPINKHEKPPVPVTKQSDIVIIPDNKAGQITSQAQPKPEKPSKGNK